MHRVNPAWPRARRSRDPRFDGRFFIGVTTTGIYCRPICPSRSPREQHVRYFATAAAAADAGFRPCLRCRPETAPGTPAWIGTPAAVARALRLIDERVLEGVRISELASAVGMGPRHLHRLFVSHVGAAPLAIVQTRRLHFAKQLIDQTMLPMTTIAMASGFGSLRRFNAAVRDTWGRNPSSLRRLRDEPGRADATYEIRLPYREPFDWSAILDFLRHRAIEGLEDVGDHSYTRVVPSHDPASSGMGACGDSAGLVRVAPAKGAALSVTVQDVDPRALYQIASRLRRLFDLEADPQAIHSVLAQDAPLAQLVRRRPGLRVPGAWDPFEVVVRAVLGQQSSVAAARRFASRLVAEHGRRVEIGGRSWTLFPSPEGLVSGRLEAIGITGRRAEAIRLIARGVVEGRLPLAPHAAAEALECLGRVPGIGPWTLQYIAMRAFADPDAFPAGDAVLSRVAGLDADALVRRAERWRPWRAYAAIHLWKEADHGSDLLHDDREPRRRADARRQSHAAPRPALR